MDIMTLKNITKHRHSTIFCTVLVTIILCLIFLSMLTTIYQREKEECYEYLHLQTKQIKDDFRLQMNSDSQSLDLVANFAAQAYSDGHDMSIVFNSFEPTGLIRSVGILLPDNTFITKRGVLNFDGKLSFDDELKKGKYISGRVADVTNPKLEIIRHAVPIIHNGETVGILYGSIDLDALHKRYSNAVSGLDAQLFVFENKNGNILINTLQNDFKNINSLKDREFEDGYSFDQLISQEKGYTVFKSKVWDEKLHIHYAPLEISDWKIMLARRESHVFEKAHQLSFILYLSLALMLITIVLYFLYLLGRERQKKLTTHQGSKIRKLLLDINQQQGNIKEALEKIVVYSNSRSAIFVDTDGEDHNYILPSAAEKLLTGEDRNYFISEILGYAASIHSKSRQAVDVISVRANQSLEISNPKFYSFLKKHEINSVIFAAVTDRNNHISVLGAVNPKRKYEVKTLIQDIAVCFSIAIYNKKYLNKTELAAETDSLTGLLNRVTYKKDLEFLNRENPQNFACVYIDVNELHICNNKYGHAAGDEMLIYIANTMKEVFFGHKIYRIGGDEFLVFIKDTESEDVKTRINLMTERLLPMNYHIAFGMAFRTHCIDTEDIVRDAEKRMYEAKAQYYQNKEARSVSVTEDIDYTITRTGIGEIDTLLTVMKERYTGIYKVSLNLDKATRILMPSYLGYNETENNFSKIFTNYVAERVSPDFHRAMLSFLNYDALKKQLSEGNIPRITYKKTNSENVVLSVYSFNQNEINPDNTLWVFEKI